MEREKEMELEREKERDLVEAVAFANTPMPVVPPLRRTLLLFQAVTNNLSARKKRAVINTFKLKVIRSWRTVTL